MAALASWHAGVPSIADLCEAAGISRTALYRYHRDVLEEVRRRRGIQQPVPSESKSYEMLREENNQLRAQLSQVAALVDHYFRAYEEAVAALEHKEAEMANMRKWARERPAPIKR
jgi:AcrR family transcriptional regulator